MSQARSSNPDGSMAPALKTMTDAHGRCWKYAAGFVESTQPLFCWFRIARKAQSLMAPRLDPDGSLTHSLGVSNARKGGWSAHNYDVQSARNDGWSVHSLHGSEAQSRWLDSSKGWMFGTTTLVARRLSLGGLTALRNGWSAPYLDGLTFRNWWLHLSGAW